MKRGHIEPYRRLSYDNIILRPQGDHAWYLPGRRTASTRELVRLANKRGVTISLIEHNGESCTKTRLN